MKTITRISILMLALLIVAIGNGFAQSDMCEMCHDDPSLTVTERGIPHSLYVNQAMLDSSVHEGFSCTDCHTSLDGFEDFPHAEELPGVSCADCHSDVFDAYMTGFYDHLAQRGFTGIPGCTQCHGNHNITEQTNTSQVCGICHSVQRKQFEQSIHYEKSGGKVSCTSCHSAHEKDQRGDMLPADWREFTVDKCMECHQTDSENYLSSHHFAEVKAGNERAPICTDCHSDHAIHAVEDPRSLVHIDKLDGTCDSCHPGHEATIHRKAGVDDRLETCAACHTGHNTDMERVESKIYKEAVPQVCNQCHSDERHKRENLAHGKIMIVDDKGMEANCTQCHIYHYKMADSDHLGTVTGSSLSCQNCHAEETKDYERSAHGIARRKGHTEAPNCQSCHGEEDIVKVSEQFDGQSIISLCSSCHANREITMRFQINPNVVKGYLGTYHGQVYSLGYQGEEFATCVSCHDNHLILPKDNPESTISQGHIIETCGRCHEDANVNFVSQLQHYDPMAHEEQPILSFIHFAMVWLLRITLSIFGIHTLLWIMRSIIDRIRHGKHEKLKGKYRYRRFNKTERFLHVLVVVSFLTLAMTGLPLKYSHTEAAYWIASHLLDLHTMALMHRIAAGITFMYFAIHIGALIGKLFKRQLTFKQMFWGPDSLMPQPVDVVQFVQHVGFFLGMAKKPQFGRFAYWEKFDYFAVFWGVAVIGMSGLTLWFPEFFTRLLPGWVINAAHIIHSEEALLATGFIFTIHFFNEHLRPENFPFDEVIFTGSMSEHYLVAERNIWYERLKSEGKLEEIKVKPMKTFPRVLWYIFGFTALFVGLGLLGLIVAGTFVG